ncbi:hypothetical protein T8K17_18195 [Thalassobaculum sp. OXR-137]|uniref:hypothetical protein n=1 Tax=Thalassobaculum sp. OXR-137 TaxID=3100173 RepID=UPI002AC8FA04|nr:hypothetical protein [Thalassobaculum sp. OXR-137]WPZ33162.1 hypothetical protein T8K17_18195 [Thalassobaculum sp. OXR-137]
MKLTERNSTDSTVARQAFALDVKRDPDGVTVELRISEAVLRDSINLLCKFIAIAHAASEAANDNIRQEERRERDHQDAKRRSTHRRRLLIVGAALFRFWRRRNPSPDEWGAHLDEQAAIHGISRPALVSITKLHERRAKRRLNDIRRAVALSMAQRGASGTEIGHRLGVGARAANKLVRAELDRRNQTHRDAA